MKMKRVPLFACMECGHKFYSGKAAEMASFGDDGCPGCGGSDVDTFTVPDALMADINEELVLPIVHLNGTAYQELLEQRSNVIDALRNAADVLAVMAPNGRDYYPVDGLLAAAEKQHRDRIAIVTRLLQEIKREQLAIARHEHGQLHTL